MPTRQTMVEEYQDQGDVAKSTVFVYPQYGDYRKKNRESIEGTMNDESDDHRPEVIHEEDEEDDVINAKPEEKESESAADARPDDVEEEGVDNRPDEIDLESSSDDLSTTLSTTMLGAIPSASISTTDALKPEGVVSMNMEDEEEKQNEADVLQEKVLSCSGWSGHSPCR